MYDFVIKNARVIDGTNAPWFRADVGIKDGKIAKVGKISENSINEYLDAGDLYLAPGFIDIHSHSDTSLLDYPMAESRVLQGITTELGGDCGMSVAPVNKEKLDLLRDYMGDMDYNWETLGKYLDILEEKKISVNFASAVGHGTIRLAAMGFDDRKPTKEEMRLMKKYLNRALEDGAFCMSSGLIYPPGCYADTEELIELSKELVPYGAFYETHMRNEGTEVVESVKEALEICSRSGAPLQIAHHKVTRRSNWYVSCRTTTAMIEKARMEGLDVTVDQYPYNASSTTLDSNVPSWAFVGGMEKLLERLQDPEIRKKLKEESNENHIGRWGEIFVSYAQSEKNAWAVGKSIEEIAKIRGVDPADACFDLIVEEKGRVNEINYGISEEDIEYIMSKRFTMTGSDGNAASLQYPGLPHPRWYGAFPRVISHYCRDRKLFPLEEAIHKMTGMPAARLNLPDRGLIKEGMWADLILFDFAKIKDTPTYNNPKCACEGILRVYVNGVLTAKDGKHTGARSGKILRKNHKNM